MCMLRTKTGLEHLCPCFTVFCCSRIRIPYSRNVVDNILSLCYHTRDCEIETSLADVAYALLSGCYIPSSSCLNPEWN